MIIRSKAQKWSNVKSSWPFRLGRLRSTMVVTMSRKSVNLSKSLKAILVPNYFWNSK